jgi:hypothetical protein
MSSQQQDDVTSVTVAADSGAGGNNNTSNIAVATSTGSSSNSFTNVIDYIQSIIVSEPPSYDALFGLTPVHSTLLQMLKTLSSTTSTGTNTLVDDNTTMSIELSYNYLVAVAKHLPAIMMYLTEGVGGDEENMAIAAVTDSNKRQQQQQQQGSSSFLSSSLLPPVSKKSSNRLQSGKTKKTIDKVVQDILQVRCAIILH